MSDTTPWPDWLASLTPADRVHAIVGAVAVWYSNKAGGTRCSAKDAEGFLVRLLDAPATAPSPDAAVWRDRYRALAAGTLAPVPSAAEAQLAQAKAALHRLALDEPITDPDFADLSDEIAAMRGHAAAALETIARLGEPGAGSVPHASVSAAETTEGPSAPHGEGEPVQAVSGALKAAPALPPGDYGRVELPGMRSHTGWWTPGVLAGQSVMVCTDRDGNAVAEYILGPACRFVRLPVPVVAEPAADDWGDVRAALTAGRDEDDDPDDYVAHSAACHDPDCDGDCMPF